MKNITQLFRVTENGINITSKITSAKLSQGMGKLYNVASFTSSERLEDLNNIEIIFGDTTFMGFVHSSRRVSKNTFEIIARSNNAKLTIPFSQKEEVLEGTKTSTLLFQKYEVDSGVVIRSSSAELDFGIEYLRKGTKLDAVTAIANVTGSEIFDDNTAIVIRPKEQIKIRGRDINGSDIFDFVEDSHSIDNNGVGIIWIGESEKDGGSSLDRSKSFIRAEIDKKTGQIGIYENPLQNIVHVEGVLTGGIKNFKEITEVKSIKSSEFFAKTAISKILSVKVNGVEVGATFTLNTNRIDLLEERRGELEVKYMGSYYHGIVSTIKGGYYSVDVVDLKGDVHYYQGQISRGSSKDIATVGNESVIITVPEEANYVKGFFFTEAGNIFIDPIFVDEVGTVVPMDKVIRTPVPITLAETQSTTANGWTGQNIILLISEISSIVGVKHEGLEIPYTILGPRAISVAQNYDNAVVTYTTVGFKYEIQSKNKPGKDIKMLISELSYDIYGYNPDDYNTWPAGFPQPARIDIATSLGVNVSDVQGYTVDLVTPSGTTSTLSIDKYGFVSFVVDMAGDYRLDCGTMIKGAKLVLKVSGGCDV